MSTLLILAVLAVLTAVFIGLMAVVYAIPARRTWRKEHNLPLAVPGPDEQTSEEQRDDSR